MSKTCVSCGVDVEGAGPRCLVCAGRRKTWLVAGVVIAAASGAIALVLLTSERKDAEPAADPGSAGTAAAAAVVIDADVAATPGETTAIEKCDVRRILEVTQDYNKLRKFAGTVRASTAYQQKCEHSYALDWKLFFAHEQLKQWNAAVAVATGLVVHEPNDDDFWWWRGKARSFAGEHEAAIVDLRQSLADADADNNGIQVSHIERSAKALGQPCEHAFALRWLAQVGVALRSSAERELQQSYLGNECDKLDGRGAFAWSTDGKPLSRAKIKGSVAGKAIQFTIDRYLGTTLVTRDFAAAASLPRGTEVDVMLPTGLGKGALSSADIVVGTARASAVPVVIVDKLPQGIDAVLGLSFLWRFDVQPNENGDGFEANASER